MQCGDRTSDRVDHLHSVGGRGRGVRVGRFGSCATVGVVLGRQDSVYSIGRGGVGRKRHEARQAGWGDQVAISGCRSGAGHRVGRSNPPPVYRENSRGVASNVGVDRRCRDAGH